MAIRDYKPQLGIFGDNVAEIIVAAFEQVGADGGSSVATVVATSSVTTPLVQSDAGTADFALSSDGSDSVLNLVGDAATSASLSANATIASVTLNGDADTIYDVSATGTAIAETITCATGQYSTILSANLADAWSVTDGSADLWRWQTTTNALAGVMTAALVSTPPANQTLTNDQTITLPVGINKIVDNAGNVTGIIMTEGILDGQIVNLVNAGSGSVTFAAAATSKVADGASAVIATLRAVTLVWDAGATRWFRTG